MIEEEVENISGINPSTEGFIDTVKEAVMKMIAWIREKIKKLIDWFRGKKNDMEVKEKIKENDVKVDEMKEKVNDNAKTAKIFEELITSDDSEEFLKKMKDIAEQELKQNEKEKEVLLSKFKDKDEADSARQKLENDRRITENEKFLTDLRNKNVRINNELSERFKDLRSRATRFMELRAAFFPNKLSGSQVNHIDSLADFIKISIEGYRNNFKLLSSLHAYLKAEIDDEKQYTTEDERVSYLDSVRIKLIAIISENSKDDIVNKKQLIDFLDEIPLGTDRVENSGIVALIRPKGYICVPDKVKENDTYVPLITYNSMVLDTPDIKKARNIISDELSNISFENAVKNLNTLSVLNEKFASDYKEIVKLYDNWKFPFPEMIQTLIPNNGRKKGYEIRVKTQLLRSLKNLLIAVESFSNIDTRVLSCITSTADYYDLFINTADKLNVPYEDVVKSFGKK
jgi:hypothetical protein